MTPALDTALDYLARGWSVIPILAGTKRPAIPWKDFQFRRATEAEVRGWFTRWPDAGVAIVCGAVSGLVVVDRDGDAGAKSLTVRGITYPDTPRVRTRRGEHVYFAHPGPAVESRANPDNDRVRAAHPTLAGLDWKGDGGYVLAPPTVHQEGPVYAWDVAPDAAPLAPLPGWFLEMYAEAHEDRGARVAPATPTQWADDARPFFDHEPHDDVTPHAEGEAPALYVALDAPYSMAQWRDDLRAMEGGTATGFDVLDELRMRWLPGKLTAVVARPGAGKTAFLLEACARYLDTNPTGRAVFLSWEEPLADVVSRLVQRADAIRTAPSNTSFPDTFAAPQLYAETIRAGGRDDLIPQTCADRIATARADVDALLTRLYLVDGDQFGRDVQAVLRDLAAWMRTPGAPRMGLVCVDYFQKLRGATDAHSRQTELADVADTLRRFAKGATFTGDDVLDAETMRCAVPVLVGAQVNRTTLQNGDGTGHPTGDTVREADDLLNDAAAVVALSWEKAPDDSPAEAVRWLRVTVPKHRGGRARGTFAGDDVARILWHPARSWISPSTAYGVDPDRDGDRAIAPLMKAAIASARKGQRANAFRAAFRPNAPRSPGERLQRPCTPARETRPYESNSSTRGVGPLRRQIHCATCRPAAAVAKGMSRRAARRSARRRPPLPFRASTVGD